MKNKITKFYIAPEYLEMWMHQNKAEYTGDFVDGVLLDNFVLSTQRGFAFVYEHYLNPNQSDYLVIYAIGEDNINKMFDDFYEFQDKSETEFANEG